MANGAGEVTETRASRTLGGRAVLALLVSVLATAALAVPLAYQAHSARDGQGPGTATSVPTTTSSAPTPTEPAPTSTIETVPVQVMPTTLERTDESLTWASAVDDPAARPLEGATVRGRVVVQYQVPPDRPPVVRTEFWIDRAEERRPPEHVDPEAPFTLTVDPADPVTTTAPEAFDSTVLDDGPHTVVVQATHADGDVVRHISRFDVDND